MKNCTSFSYCPLHQFLVFYSNSTEDVMVSANLYKTRNYTNAKVHYVFLKTKTTEDLNQKLISLFPDIKAVISCFSCDEKQNWIVSWFKNEDIKEFASILNDFPHLFNY